MALGKYSRVDGRRPASSYCSTVTVVVFVGLCLVGVWMMTSSVVVPDDSSSSEAGSGVKQQVPENGGSFGNNDNSEVKEKVPENDKLPVGDGTDGVKEDGAKEESPVAVNNSPEESSETQTQRAPDTENDAVKENELQKQDDQNETPVKDNGDGKDDSNNALEGESQPSEGESRTSEGENQGDKGEEAEVGEKNQDTGDEGTDSGKNETTEGEQDQGQPETKVTETVTKGMEQNSTEENSDTGKLKELLPDPSQSDLLNETHTQTGSWSTQADESQNEKKVQKPSNEQLAEYSWKLCNVSAGPDYMPCLDNVKAIKKLKTTKHYEHRERHCPAEGPTCLVPLPNGYKPSIRWPDSRKKIWYANVPHTKLVAIKGHQNWVKESGEFLTFPGGGTQFKHGALHYIDFIQESFPEIAWGKKSRVVLDVGCGVASFGGFLFDRDVLTMSFAPNDEHEAQVQFALERGIPAISAVMGTKRLPFPSNVFDVVHCARCRVPWHVDGGMLLLELNRLLRPGGYFVWSATPVYRKTEEDVGIWKAMSELTKSICWEMVSITKDAVDEVGIAIYKKPSSNECYEKRLENNPPFCEVSDDPNAAWYIQLQPCLHQVPTDPSVRGSQWPEEWPKKLETPPYWLNSSQRGVYGQAAPDDFNADYEHWKHVVSKSYLSGLGVDWSTVRNVMDMRSVYGGFAAALKEMKVWVMNVVPIDSADTLPIIYERGLFGIYHDWCESFSTYPRTYDLLHADHLFSKTKKRCSLLSVMAEADRILRPQGMIIVRDNVETINEVENIGKSLHWEIRLEYSKEREGLLCMQKTMWRPEEVETSI